MSERSLPQADLIVATAHDLLMAPPGGEMHDIAAPQTPEGGLDIARVIRASEIREQIGTTTVELESGETRQLPVFEVSYTGLENPTIMREIMAGLALNQVMVGSRLGGRYASHINDLPGDYIETQNRFGHPAHIVRDLETGAIIAAQRIGVPQQTDYRGPNVADMERSRPFDGTNKLINYLPEDMYLLSGDDVLQVANCGRIADVNFDYEPVAQTDQGVIIAHSRPKEITGMPEGPAKNELRLVHTEVLFESLRLGIASPDDASRMMIACGVRRMPSGQQGNMFTGLAYYSTETLRDIYERIKL